MTIAFAAAAAILRLAAAAIFLAQGIRKVFAPPDAAHGRGGLAAAIGREGMPAPERLAWLVAVTELVGGAALGIGLFTRLAAVPLVVVLLVAIYSKRRAGFLGGWDWPLSVLAIVVAILLLGPGPWSLDGLVGTERG